MCVVHSRRNKSNTVSKNKVLNDRLLAGVTVYGTYGPELIQLMQAVNGGRMPAVLAGVRAECYRIYVLLVHAH
jgi:hypothetical protein